MQSRGDVQGLPLVGKGAESDKRGGKGWEAGSGLRAAPKLWSREHSVPASPAVFPITNPGHRGYSPPQTDHIRTLKKMPLLFVNIHIHCDLEKQQGL